MPWFRGYVSWLKREKPEGYASFRKYYEANGRKSKETDWVNSGESQVLVALATYIESMFARYDSDRSGTSGRTKAPWRSRSSARLFCKVLCTCQDDAALRDAFDFVMTHGGAPEGVGQRFGRAFRGKSAESSAVTAGTRSIASASSRLCDEFFHAKDGRKECRSR